MTGDGIDLTRAQIKVLPEGFRSFGVYVSGQPVATCDSRASADMVADALNLLGEYRAWVEIQQAAKQTEGA